MSEHSEPRKGLSPEIFKFFAEHCVKCVRAMEKKEVDYTPESLLIVDKMINKWWPKDFFKDVKPARSVSLEHLFKSPPRSGETLTIVVLTFGSYLGEVLIRSLDAKWEKNEHVMFGWCVNVSAGERYSFLSNVFHIAHESLLEPSKLFNSFVMGAVWKKVVERGGLKALREKDNLKRELEDFYERHKDVIKSVLEPGEKPPSFYGFFAELGEGETKGSERQSDE